MVTGWQEGKVGPHGLSATFYELLSTLWRVFYFLNARRSSYDWPTRPRDFFSNCQCSAVTLITLSATQVGVSSAKQRAFVVSIR